MCFIGIKIIIIFFYVLFRPYINGFFDFFKLVQEIHFILISMFFILIHNKSYELK
jgi:hypothetical protein